MKGRGFNIIAHPGPPHRREQTHEAEDASERRAVVQAPGKSRSGDVWLGLRYDPDNSVAAVHFQKLAVVD